MRALFKNDTSRVFKRSNNSKGNNSCRSPITRSAKISVSKADVLSGSKTPTKSRGKSKSGKGRKYYSVSDDWTIMVTIKRNSKASMSKIAQKVSSKVGRSSESVRYRIKNYLSKLDKKDLKKIKVAAKVRIVFNRLRKPLITTCTLAVERKDRGRSLP